MKYYVIKKFSQKKTNKNSSKYFCDSRSDWLDSFSRDTLYASIYCCQNIYSKISNTHVGFMKLYDMKGMI